MTRLERENKWLNGGWSQNSVNRAKARIDEAAALTQEFIAYNGQESPVCATSLALIIGDLLQRLDDVEQELSGLRRVVEND
jgi:hypothetical protein